MNSMLKFHVKYFRESTLHDTQECPFDNSFAISLIKTTSVYLHASIKSARGPVGLFSQSPSSARFGLTENVVSYNLLRICRVGKSNEANKAVLI